VDKIFKTLAKLASIFTLKDRKQLAKNVERVSERKENPSPHWR
jgi:hypothetical protein